MEMVIAPEDAGQIIEVSHGWCCGQLYRRIYDKSDRSTMWEVADSDEVEDLDETWEAVNGSPRISNWTECAAPDEGE